MALHLSLFYFDGIKNHFLYFFFLFVDHFDIK